jgi:hypothetical protein
MRFLLFNSILNQKEIISLLKEINYYTSNNLDSYLLILSRNKALNLYKSINNSIEINLLIKLGLLKMLLNNKNRIIIENMIISINKYVRKNIIIIK